MNTAVLTLEPDTCATMGAHPKGTTMRGDLAPSRELAVLRLAALRPGSMPWLRRGVDLTPPDGGPEVVGRTEYLGTKP